MGRKLKILHLTGSLSIGGAQRLILGLINQTNKSEFDVHVYSFGSFRKESFLSDFQTLVDISFVNKPVGSFYDPRNLASIVSYLRRHRINLIQTHMIDSDITGCIAGVLTGIPVIVTLQNEPQSYDEHRFDRRWLAHMALKYLAIHAVAVSGHIKDLFVRQWKIPQEKISIIYNAIDLENYLTIREGTQSEYPESGLHISNIARLTPQKAQHILLDAFKMVLTRYPDTVCSLVGIGDLEKKLKEKTHSLGIADKVIFAGARRDIPEILAKTDIFVLSSLWEGLPLAAIEAMAAARPVILTDVGGNRELLNSGVSGLIVPPDDPHALANAIISLMNDQNKRLEIGRSSREEARARFGIEIIASQYQTLYKSICSDIE